jgi:hypothetical protein
LSEPVSAALFAPSIALFIPSTLVSAALFAPSSTSFTPGTAVRFAPRPTILCAPSMAEVVFEVRHISK